eukprot:gnl/TRDRNA2_/TRDRNA2_164931_c5_seq1.p1 gnl/TRDRNA2_/TRDRNA2_164931_c5~~gnl/TRDRNA2_/TRDRNA2_164931_c5_seq1.p1  ORF type:complete len:155 (+),score=25.92 gnl/TRDRNA2_/TRDRNA2_164931_c5_seq1:50-466(+)
MTPAIKSLSERMPVLDRNWSIVQLVILLGTLVSAVLGILSLQTWIPMTVAMVAGIESIAQFEQTSSQLTGANASLAQLKKLRIWWQSLSMVEKRMPTNKTQLVEEAEEAIEGEVAAWTQGLLRRMKRVTKQQENEAEP